LNQININQSNSYNSFSQALYELASENNCLEEIESQIQGILSLMEKSTDFNNLIKDPTINASEQLSTIDMISKKANFHSLLIKFLIFITTKRKLFYLNTISKDFLKICSYLRGELVAEIKSAKKLKDEELNKIKDELSKNFNKKIKIQYQYDPSLLGGLIVKIGSVMIDNSLNNKLNKIKNSMIEA